LNIDELAAGWWFHRRDPWRNQGAGRLARSSIEVGGRAWRTALDEPALPCPQARFSWGCL